MEKNGRSGGDWARWAGTVLVIILSVLALSSKWGGIQTTLTQIGTDLSEVSREVKDLNTRLSFLEGKLNGRSDYRGSSGIETESNRRGAGGGSQ